MADTVLDSTGAIPARGVDKVFVWEYTHDFSETSCLSANTLSVLLPADVLVVGGSYKVTTAGTTANLAVGVTGNLDYVVAAGAMQTLTADHVVANDIATPSFCAGATNYLVLNPDADMLAGIINIKLVLASLN